MLLLPLADAFSEVALAELIVLVRRVEVAEPLRMMDCRGPAAGGPAEAFATERIAAPKFRTPPQDTTMCDDILQT